MNNSAIKILNSVQKMLRIFNSKLYNKYYPLETDVDKDRFLNNENIIRDLHRVTDERLLDILVKERKYRNQMRSTVSIFGNLKFGNILYNRVILEQMERDPSYKKDKDIYKLMESLENKLVYYDYDAISVDEVNSFLHEHNKIHRRNWLKVSVTIAFVVSVSISCLL